MQARRLRPRPDALSEGFLRLIARAGVGAPLCLSRGLAQGFSNVNLCFFGATDKNLSKSNVCLQPPSGTEDNAFVNFPSAAARAAIASVT